MWKFIHGLAKAVHLYQKNLVVYPWHLIGIFHRIQQLNLGSRYCSSQAWKASKKKTGILKDAKKYSYDIFLNNFASFNFSVIWQHFLLANLVTLVWKKVNILRRNHCLHHTKLHIQFLWYPAISYDIPRNKKIYENNSIYFSHPSIYWKDPAAL